MGAGACLTFGVLILHYIHIRVQDVGIEVGTMSVCASERDSERERDSRKTRKSSVLLSRRVGVSDQGTGFVCDLHPSPSR